jgi:hypothetical protein
MSRRRLSAILVSIAAFLPVFGQNAKNSLWLDQLGDLKKVSSKPISVSAQDKDLWDEYGLEASESAQYSGKGKTLNGTLYRLKDPTGGLAAFQWLRPAGAKPSAATNISVDLPNGGLMALLGNYVVQFDGKPNELPLKQLYFNLPRVDQSSLPTIHLPAKNMVAGSERYILGPVSLARFEPQVAPSVASFSLGAEGQVARYKTGTGEMQMAIFSYPTPQIARQRLDDFLKISNSRAKRSSHLVAVVAQPSSADEAERLLALVNYEPNVTIHESQNKKPELNAGDLILGACLLAVALGVASIILGMFFGGFRVMLGRFGYKTATEEFTALDINRK